MSIKQMPAGETMAIYSREDIQSLVSRNLEYLQLCKQLRQENESLRAQLETERTVASQALHAVIAPLEAIKTQFNSREHSDAKDLVEALSDILECPPGFELNYSSHSRITFAEIRNTIKIK